LKSLAVTDCDLNDVKRIIFATEGKHWHGCLENVKVTFVIVVRCKQKEIAWVIQRFTIGLC